VSPEKQYIIEGDPHTAWVITDDDDQYRDVDVRITPGLSELPDNFLSQNVTGGVDWTPQLVATDFLFLRGEMHHSVAAAEEERLE